MKPVEFIKAYGPNLLCTILIMSLLALPEYTYANAMVQAMIILFWSYSGHVLAHHISSDWPFNILNPHVYLHHQKSISIPRWLELVIESLVNFSGFLILYIIQQLLGLKLFSTSLLLGAALLYIIIHILDYSIIGKEDHKLHHEKTFCNYDPEYFDIIFNTRCDPDKPYTNMSWEIPHIIFGFTLALILKSIYNLD